MLFCTDTRQGNIDNFKIPLDSSILIDITHSETTSDYKVLAVECRAADPAALVVVHLWKMNVYILLYPDIILNFQNVWDRLVSTTWAIMPILPSGGMSLLSQG